MRCYRVKNAGRVVPKDELLDALGPGVIVTESSRQRAASLAVAHSLSAAWAMRSKLRQAWPHRRGRLNGITVLELVGEASPGLPLARGGSLTVVTKSGGFGDEETLNRLLAPFHAQEERTV